MAISNSRLRQKTHCICICGLNSSFDQNNYRCHFGTLENIAFLNISLQVNIEHQPTICLYIDEGNNNGKQRQHYIEFENKKYPIAKIVRFEKWNDSSFHTLKVSGKVLRRLIQQILQYFLEDNRSFSNTFKDILPYKANWSDYELTHDSYNENGADWHEYRGLKIDAPFNSRGTIRRIEEMFNNKIFSPEHFNYFANIVPLLEKLEWEKQMN